MRHDVISAVATAAAQVARGQTKEAGLGSFAKSMLTKAVTRPAMTRAGKALTMPSGGGWGAAPRQFAPGRALGAAAAGTVAGGHLYNAGAHAAQRAGDYMGITDPTARFKDLSQRYTQQQDGMIEQSNAAIASGDYKGADRLQKQMAEGNFGSPWRLGGLNPFAGPDNNGLAAEMRHARDTMSGRIGAEQNTSNAARASIEKQMQTLRSRLAAPGLLPQQQTSYQNQIDQHQRRLETMPSGISIKHQQMLDSMREAGMGDAWHPGATPKPWSPTSPGTYANPQGGGYSPQGAQMSPALRASLDHYVNSPQEMGSTY